MENTLEQQHALFIEPPPGKLTRAMGIDFGKLAAGLAKAGAATVLSGATAGWSSLAAVPGVADVWQSFSYRSLPPQQAAWLWLKSSINLAIARVFEQLRSALADLAVENNLSQEELEKRANVAAPDVDQAMLGEKIPFELALFERPADSAIARKIHDGLRRWLLAIGLKRAVVRSACAAWPSFFLEAAYCEWIRKIEELASVEKALRGPMAAALSMDRQWRAYHASLRAQVDRFLFIDTFSLRQVYVALRCLVPPLSQKGNDQKASMIMAWLDEIVLHWIEQSNPQDAIRIISGEPGSGKSTFARMLCDRIISSSPLRVVYVPLYLLDLTVEFDDALERFCERDAFLPPEALMFKSHHERVLLVLDGLDELSKRGGEAQKVAGDLIDAARKWTAAANAGGIRVQILILGRPMSIDAQVARSASGEILRVLPFIVEEEYLQEEISDPGKLGAIDQRDLWWRKYGTAVGEEWSGLPDSVRKADVSLFSRQPLHNYLLALSYRRQAVNFEAARVDLTVVYDDLLRRVWERTYDLRLTIKPVVAQRLTFEEFCSVLEEIAIASWHDTGRIVSRRIVEEYCRAAGIEHLLRAVADSLFEGLTQIILAFYFRPTREGVLGTDSFEFTHREFGEYLAARRIARQIWALPQEASIANLDRWFNITGPERISRNMLFLLRAELRRQFRENTRSRQPLEEWPLRGISYFLTKRQLSVKSRNASEALWAAAHAHALSVGVSPFRLLPANAPRHILQFWLRSILSTPASDDDSVLRRCLDHVAIADQVLSFEDLRGTEFVGSQFTDCRFRHVAFDEAKLDVANFKDCWFSDCSFDGASSNGAPFVNCHFERCHLESNPFPESAFRDCRFK